MQKVVSYYGNIEFNPKFDILVLLPIGCLVGTMSSTISLFL